MDAEKLFRILKDIQREEEELKINEKIDSLRNNIAQNNPEASKIAQTELEELIKQVQENGISYNFSRTESALLERVNGTDYFGEGLIDEFEKTFSLRSFELPGRLEEYRNQRNDFLQKMRRLITAFADAGIQDYRPDKYEVGIVLPGDESDVSEISKRIKELNILISAISEAAGRKRGNIVINRVSNNSLEFFSLQPVEVAVLLSNLILNISLIWEKIGRFRKRIKEIDEDASLSSAAKKKIKQVIEEEISKVKDEILKNLPDEILKRSKLEEGRKNEIRNQIKISLRAIFGWFEIGVELDITPIRTTQPEGVPETEKKKIDVVQRANFELREIYKLPPEMKKLPFGLSDEDDEPNKTKE